MQSSTPIAIEQLTKTWGGQRGVADISFTVEAGEVFGFLGPNGAGKTTTIRTLMGFVRPTAGRASIFGYDCWRQAARIHRLVGFVAGDVRLYERLTGRELLELLGRMRGLQKPPRLEEIARRFDLDLGQPVRALSKGNRQKVALVAAFMHDPPLLILDEPTGGLDPIMQRVFLDLMREERDGGRTIFLSSHLVHEVERICSRVGIIREGRLVAVDSIAALRARSPRRLTVTFAAEPDRPLLALPNAPAIARNGHQVTYAVTGDLGPVLRILSLHPIEELTYGSSDLEDIFQSYYAPAAGEGHSADAHASGQP